MTKQEPMAYHKDTGESDKNISPVSIENDKLFEFLKGMENK